MNRSERWAPFLFLAPAVITLLAVGFYPTIIALVTSFRTYLVSKPQVPKDFVGFANYLTVLGDPTYWQALGRTFGFLLLVLPIELALGLGIALLLHKPGLGLLATLLRVSLVIPMATTFAVVGLVGRLLFNDQFGVVNYGLTALGLPAVQWLGQPTTAFLAVALMDVWQWTPFVALVLLAGLTMVPAEIEEAARLDAGSQWDILRYVQLPFLLPGITAVLILRTADILKLFDVIFVMTRGGPGSATELIAVYIQRVGFRVFDQGVASAQAILLLVITIILSRLYIRLVYREIAG
ncbi:MAG: carbohydrate ABC transporter permease [Geminicoccaceae bacterium]